MFTRLATVLGAHFLTGLRQPLQAGCVDRAEENIYADNILFMYLLKHSLHCSALHLKGQVQPVSEKVKRGRGCVSTNATASKYRLALRVKIE